MAAAAAHARSSAAARRKSSLASSMRPPAWRSAPRRSHAFAQRCTHYCRIRKRQQCSHCPPLRVSQPTSRSHLVKRDGAVAVALRGGGVAEALQRVGASCEHCSQRRGVPGRLQSQRAAVLLLRLGERAAAEGLAAARAVRLRRCDARAESAAPLRAAAHRKAHRRRPWRTGYRPPR
jgi:hypothetical protein